jgi:predicted SpoU family rRNA methylase
VTHDHVRKQEDDNMTTQIKLAKGFQANNLTVLGANNGKDSEAIAAYSNEFKGKKYVHIRVIYQDDNGNWNPGKGVSMLAANAPAIFTAAGKLVSTSW